MVYYPRECYSINETATKNSMRAYDEKIRKFEEKRQELHPDYYSLGLRDRLKINDDIALIMGYKI